MTPHVLDGAFERVAGAEEHLADLRERIRHVSQLDTDVIIAEFDPKPPHRPKILIPALFYLSMRIPILTGEICYNLRSALDYLVFELAKLDSGAAQDFTQFPIEDTKKGFKGRINTHLKGVSAAHVAWIAKLQPCMGCGWTKVLSFISNPDKHRELTPVSGNVGIFIYFPFEDPEFRTSDSPIRRAPHPTRGEVYMKVEAKLTPVIVGPNRLPLVNGLEIVRLKVAETLTLFKSEFEQ